MMRRDNTESRSGGRMAGLLRRRAGGGASLFATVGLAVAVLATAFLAPAGNAAAKSPAAPQRYAEALFLLHRPAGLNRFAAAVSDPSSPRYRRYASVDRLVNRFGASPKAKQSTLRWLAGNGLRGKVGPTGAWVTARVPRRLLGEVLPPRGAGASAATLTRSVPATLRDHVSQVELLPADDRYRRLASVAPQGIGTAATTSGQSSFRPHTGTAAGCAAGTVAGRAPPFSAFTPNQYLAAYGHSTMHKAGFRGKGMSVAVVEIDGFRHSDIATFAKCFGLRLPPIETIPVEIPKRLPPGPETTLDLEVLTAAAPQLDRIYVYEGTSTTGGVMLTTAAALGSKGHRPDVISISLGGCEAGLGPELVAVRAMNNVLAVAAGAGISVLIASGDQGSSACEVESEGVGSALPLLSVSNPASSILATAVGGTNLLLNEGNRIGGQIVWNDAPHLFGGGGGGNSLMSPQRPWWQRLPALRRHGPGRIVPDISALADVLPGYALYCTASECGEFPQTSPGWVSVGGTSAATPLMAGGILLANQYAKRHGQRPLGFLNPLLYSLGADKKSRRNVFYDVVEGNNDLGVLTSAGAALGCCRAGPGFDAASGWGSLKVRALARAARAAARR